MRPATVSHSFTSTDVDQLILFSDLKKELSRKMIYQITKRIFDVVCAFILMILILPLFLIISIAVFFSDGKGIFFTQERYGFGRTKFKLYKFRSMLDKENRFSATFVDGNGSLNNDMRDPRVTKIGRIIRKTSIDELPQLYNILKGDMSFVGPRPLIIEMVENHEMINKLRTLVKPGLTGLLQITARNNNNSVLNMIDYDIEYIKRCSFKYDLKIILKTIPAVISCRGAR